MLMFLTLVCCAVFHIYLSVGLAYGLFFGHNIMLSGSSSASNPLVAVHKDNIYVIWTDEGSDGNSDIILRKSTDRGASFSAAENLSSNLGNSTDPHIFVYRNNVYVAWSDDTTGSYDINFRKSSDYGDNFNRTKNLSRNNGSSVSPQVAASGDNVYVVWSDNTTGNYEINLRGSSDYGDTFGGTKLVYRNNGSSVSPQIAAIGDNVYVVWIDYTGGSNSINFKASYNRGNDFDLTSPVGRNNGSSVSPQIAEAGNNVYVVWSDNKTGSYDINFRKSSDYGDNFNRTKNLSRNNGSSVSPQVAASGDNVYVVWSDNTTGNYEINLRGSSDYGDTFGGTKLVYRNNGSSVSPQIAAIGDNVYLAWTASAKGGSEILFTASGDGGDHFDNALNLSRTRSLSSSAYVTEYQKDLYLVWIEGDSNGRGDVFFKRISQDSFPRNTH